MLDNILRLANKFDVFIFDLFGVIWNGKSVIEGMPETLKELKRMGKEVILLSNAPVKGYKMEEDYVNKGILKGIHYDAFVTSGDLVYDYFSQDKRELKYYVYGKSEPELFENSKYKETTKLEDADFVFLGMPKILKDGKWENVFDMTQFEEELKRMYDEEKILICPNPDLKAQAVEGGYAIREGSLAVYYQELGGDVEFFGKPYPEIFDFALKDCDVDDNKIVMIGDTLETDILGASSYGIKSALITNGVSNENMIQEGETSNIKEYAKSLNIIPDYFL